MADLDPHLGVKTNFGHFWKAIVDVCSVTFDCEALPFVLWSIKKNLTRRKDHLMADIYFHRDEKSEFRSLLEEFLYNFFNHCNDDLASSRKFES